MRVSVIGLGKLGAPLASVLASAGHTVIGVDSNQAAVDAVNKGVAPVQETGLQDLMSQVGDRLSACSSFGEAIAATDISMVVVPTPSLPEGNFSLNSVVAAVEAIGSSLRGQPAARWHTVVITSTVSPGSTDGPVRAALERTSGRLVGADIGLCYSPEFIALGSVITDLRNPDVVLIGEADGRSGDVVEGLLTSVVGPAVPVARMTPVNAELTKIAVNTFVTTKISFANMLAEICERTPGADVDVVTAAVGRDSRIGNKYLRGATGYGGPCFPRDNAALAAYARSVGTSADLADATERVNRRQVDRLLDRVLSVLPDGGTVGILGLSYKPASSVVEESTGLALTRALAAIGRTPVVYDPVALPNAGPVLEQQAVIARSAVECVQQSDVIVVTTPWPEFRQLEPSLFTSAARKVVIDCWRLLPAEELADVADVVTIGAYWGDAEKPVALSNAKGAR